MPGRPLILFPSPEKADREAKPPSFIKMAGPAIGRQYNRLQPTFTVLQTAFEQKNMRIQNSPVGMNPDFALVFEVIGSVDNFYTAVKHSDGLEWLFDKESDSFEPDDDFYLIDRKTNERSNDSLNGKLYCIMSNQQAMTQLLSLWRRYNNGEEDVFKRNFSGLRDIFTKIKAIRTWNAQDRIAETHVLDYWRESLEIDGDVSIPFEIELFYRDNPTKRTNATQTISHEVQELGGRILQECILNEIAYHGVLVKLPRNAIERLVQNYEGIALSQVDDIMFFRPTCQSAFISSTDSQVITPAPAEQPLPDGNPIAAVLDGMPIQNHNLLRGRVVIDDPDDYSSGYESKYRLHGTAMTSLVIYGDLNNGERPVGSPIYVRPILRPIQTGADCITECVPSDKLFIDVLHRAVKRMIEGENGEPATAPTVKVINLSVGDPVRQLASTMSPLARLIDYLSYKYKVLFIISAGNHGEIVSLIGKTFSELKTYNIAQRGTAFYNAIEEYQRNLKVLAPAESLNSLTIGALYDDNTNPIETTQAIWAIEKGLPSPASAIGKGYRSIITPDLFYNGGRKFVKGKYNGKIEWALTGREPGCKVAAPFGTGDGSGQTYSFGTSDAAAQITHESIKCYDVLSQVFHTEMGSDVPPEFAAILLKAMLTHGASWTPIAEKLSEVSGTSPKKLSKWLGNGVPDVGRVQECTKERITLIGLGALRKDEGDIFKLPLPIDFSTRLIKRKLTVTLSYLSPTVPNKQAYRSMQLWFTLNDGDKGLVKDRQNTEWQAVLKGTLQHEIFTGEAPIVWNDDDLIIKVNCKEDAGGTRSPVPYCLFVTFEVAEGYDIDLYTSVSTKIRHRVQIQNT